ncbi:TylF/MycF/NovP-related O-methyltransferase [Merismopedia glauca]|uniref:Methyltransferase n=1 Tax=Merismopedia glauca CCAP 1448/3 TaxID=1296344 RepID=A0A2T1C7C4_9CYAN|nr:TylF/MycF/NovP-related O-methyltransferase [Merismopedia glauca]PSB04134.1 hypothetical protein C7B64_05180 [Merismopedia glauca CCAP 1448/3]
MDKINSTHSFPHNPPYQIIYAERIPLLHIFRTAVANLHSSKYEKGNTLSANLHRFLELLRNSKTSYAAECGIYLGNSLIACAEIARESGLPIHLYGLDTFAGLPPLSEADKLHAPEKAIYRDKVMFADTSIEEVQGKIDERGLTKYITLIPGLFQDSFSKLPKTDYFFVNIDCDLYEPHLECLEFFYSSMEPGGIIFFDDYHSVDYPMARKAIDKYMKDRPEELFHLRFGGEKNNHTKAFMVKY